MLESAADMKINYLGLLVALFSLCSLHALDNQLSNITKRSGLKISRLSSRSSKKTIEKLKKLLKEAQALDRALAEYEENLSIIESYLHDFSPIKRL